MDSAAIARGVAIIVEEPLTFECKGDLVYVSDPITGLTQAFRLHTFNATFLNAARCMQECYGLRSAEVISFPTKVCPA